MRMLIGVWLVFCLGAVSASAGGGLGVFGSYMDSKDPGTAYGGGGKLKVDLGKFVALEVRGSYLTNFEVEEAGVQVRFEDLALIPVEGDLVLQLPLGEKAGCLYGGGGGGYYVLPEYDLVEYDGPGGTHKYDLDDTFGFFAVAGLQLNLGDNAALFAEVQYRVVEVEGAEVDGEEVEFSDNWVVEFTGLTGSAGLLFRW